MTVAGSTDHRLAARLATAQRAGRLPSVVAAVVRDGEVAWQGAHGQRTGGALAPGPDVQYRIGSITKTLTAVLVLQLVAEGRLTLDDRLGALLGEVGYADRSLRSLLAHDAGIQAEPAGPWWERSPGVAWPDLAAAHDGSGAVLPAHQQFHYSNLGFALLGRVVEEQTGGPWWDAVRERVLRPLGMARTSYLPEGPAARGYSVHPYAGTLHEEPATDTGAMAPAGQLWSTTSDLATYARFLLHGHPDVLSLDALLGATHPRSGDRHAGLEQAHGLGFALARGGSGMLVGHTGSMPGFLAGVFVDHDRQTGAVVLANGTTGVAVLALVRDLLDTLESCEPTIRPAWVPEERVPAEFADLLGVWHWGNTAFVFGIEDGLLVARQGDEPQYTFSIRDGRVVGTTGYHTGESLRVHRNADGGVSHLEIATFVFTREPSSS
jgi:D-alanyl-D-alanine carboxypeptidase